MEKGRNSDARARDQRFRVDSRHTTRPAARRGGARPPQRCAGATAGRARSAAAAPTSAAPAEYPKEFERDVTLKDGTRLRLRPIRPDDAERLSELYDRLSRHTAYQRFFTPRGRSQPTAQPSSPADPRP